jgi:hypothetical protein
MAGRRAGQRDERKTTNIANTMTSATTTLGGARGTGAAVQRGRDGEGQDGGPGGVAGGARAARAGEQVGDRGSEVIEHRQPPAGDPWRSDAFSDVGEDGSACRMAADICTWDHAVNAMAAVART